MSVDAPIEVVRAMRAENTDALPVWLLKIYEETDEGLPAPGTSVMRIANDTQSLVGPDGFTYMPFPFSVTLPSQTGTESPVLRVTARDVNLVIVDDLVRSAGTRDRIKADVFVVQRGVVKNSRHTAFVTYEGFEMVNAVSNASDLRVDLTARNYFDAPLTKHWFGPGDFPGLF